MRNLEFGRRETKGDAPNFLSLGNFGDAPNIFSLGRFGDPSKIFSVTV